MHLIKIEQEPQNGGVRIYCPYCKMYVWAGAGYAVITHQCTEAGYILFMNGYGFVGVPNYLKEERTKK